MFATGMGPIADTFFALATMLIAIPTGVKIFNWIGTVWGGSIQYRVPMLFALAFIGMFVIGGLSGVMHSVAPHDLQQTDTYFVVAHFHYVLFGGSIFALTAGAYYWWPKMFGRLLDEGLGKVHFWLMFIGFNLTFFPMHFVGLYGMPRRVYTYQEGLGFEIWNQMETVGAFIIMAAFLVFIYNIIRTHSGGGPKAPADPWNGATLEWSIPSPPPEWNFQENPAVHSRDPLWETKRERGGTLPEPKPGTGHGIHIPPPSYWPLVTGVRRAAAEPRADVLAQDGPLGHRRGRERAVLRPVPVAVREGVLGVHDAGASLGGYPLSAIRSGRGHPGRLRHRATANERIADSR